MSANIQFIQYTPEQLQSEISNGVKIQLQEFLKHFKPIQPAEYLTRQQVAKMFDVDLSTVHNWCKSGKLKPLGLGSRVYFLRADIEACLIPLNQ
ncbi:Helix-turn-helix domain protein [compost metagenome]